MSERAFFTLRYALPGYTFILVTVLINFDRLQGLIETQIFIAFLAFLYLLSGSAIGFLISQSWYLFYNDVLPNEHKLGNVQRFLRERFGIRLDSWRHFTVFLDYLLLRSDKRLVSYTQRRWDLIHTLGSTLFATLIGSAVGLIIRADFLTAKLGIPANPVTSIATLAVFLRNLAAYANGSSSALITGQDLGIACVVGLLLGVLTCGLRHVWKEHETMSEVMLRDTVDAGRFNHWLARRIFSNDFFDNSTHAYIREEETTKDMKAYAKLRIETNREMLVFWAVLFFTCVVGIIELLPEIEKQSFSSGMTPSLASAQSYIFLIYFGLLIGIILSVHNAFSRYKESNKLVLDGELGPELKNYAETHPTWMDRLIRSKANTFLEAVFLVPIVAVFVLLYCARIGLFG